MLLKEKHLWSRFRTHLTDENSKSTSPLEFFDHETILIYLDGPSSTFDLQQFLHLVKILLNLEYFDIFEYHNDL